MSPGVKVTSLSIDAVIFGLVASSDDTMSMRSVSA